MKLILRYGRLASYLSSNQSVYKDFDRKRKPEELIFQLSFSIIIIPQKWLKFKSGNRLTAVLYLSNITVHTSSAGRGLNQEHVSKQTIQECF